MGFGMAQTKTIKPTQAQVLSPSQKAGRSCQAMGGLEEPNQEQVISVNISSSRQTHLLPLSFSSIWKQTIY